jgi:hypothetical protein
MLCRSVPLVDVSLLSFLLRLMLIISCSGQMHATTHTKAAQDSARRPETFVLDVQRYCGRESEVCDE